MLIISNKMLIISNKLWKKYNMWWKNGYRNNHSTDFRNISDTNFDFNICVQIYKEKRSTSKRWNDPRADA